MQKTEVSTWFGVDFYKLHPLLQQVHLYDAELSGTVQVSTGKGLGGWLGRRIALRMGVPLSADNTHRLRVRITHRDGLLYWDRCFDDKHSVRSVFAPKGSLRNGYWLETTAGVQLYLTVDIIDSGWYWRCLKIRFKGIPLPCWLFPRTKAYKRIEQGRYRFYVGVSLPLLGLLFSYTGLLDVANPAEPSMQQRG